MRQVRIFHSVPTVTAGGVNVVVTSSDLLRAARVATRLAADADHIPDLGQAHHH